MKNFNSEEERQKFNEDMDILMKIVNRHANESNHGPVQSGQTSTQKKKQVIVTSQQPSKSSKHSRLEQKYKAYKENEYNEETIEQPRKSGCIKKIIAITMGVITITGVVLVAAYSIKTSGTKGEDPNEPPKVSTVESSQDEVSEDENSKIESSREETSHEESSREETKPEGTLFPKDYDAISTCQQYKSNWFGEYIVETTEKYGVDPNYALAQLKHESMGFRHETVLPSFFMNQGYAIPGDDGEDFYNGTGYGIGQITIPEEDQVLKAVNILNGMQDTILINEQNAVNPKTNVEIYAMLNQDNQDRLLAVLVDYYNEAIGQKGCFSVDKIRRILSGENLGLPFDEQRAAKQIMNAVFNANIQCYNYGLGETLDCIEFSSDGYFLEDKFTENVREKHNSRKDFGDADYRKHVLEGVSTDKVTNYVYELSGYVTYDVTKPANDMFESYTYSPAPVQITWNYSDSGNQISR